MPLFGKKIFGHSVAKGGSENREDRPYVIAETKERFSDEREYRKRLELYEKNVWTCQATGHTNLTYFDANRSERAAREKLVKHFPIVYEEPVLQLAHHSYFSLESIIVKAQTLFQTTLVKDEKVLFTVKPGKTFEATVVCRNDLSPDKESSTAGDATQTNHTDNASSTTGDNKDSVSPSSDKENKSKLLCQTVDGAASSSGAGQKHGSSAAIGSTCQSKKKTMLPAKYDLHLTAGNKIISDVPVEHLTRQSKPPNRELIRLFVRTNAIRPHSQKERCPWIVEEDMVSRYSIQPKISLEKEREMLRLGTYYCDDEQQLNGDNESGDDILLVKKEKSLTPPKDFKSKKIEMKKDVGCSGGSSGATCKSAARDVTLPSPSSSSSSLLVISSQPTVEAATASHPNSPTTGAKKKLAPIFNKVTVNGKPTGTGRPRGRPRKIRDPAELAAALAAKQAKQQKKRRKKTTSMSGDKPHKRAKTSAAVNEMILGTNKNVQMVVKSMTGGKKHQATLMEIARKNAGKLASSSSPVASTSSLLHSAGSMGQIRNAFKRLKQPSVVTHLLNLKREKKFRPHKYKLTLNQAIRLLNEKQRDNLPIEVKEDVIKRWEQEELKKKFMRMTPEERKEFKREQRKLIREQNVNYFNNRGPIEDQFLVRDQKSRELPFFTPVQLSTQITNDMFGKLAMLCEFVHSYHSLLNTAVDDHKQFNIFALSHAVTSGPSGFQVTGRLLVMFLQVLLADDLTKDYRELGFEISQIQVLPETCCELLRICVRLYAKKDDSNDGNDDAGINTLDSSNLTTTAYECSELISKDIMERVLECELYDLSAQDQIEVMTSLAYRVMNTYAVQMYMDDKRQKANDAWSELNVKRKAEKQEQKERIMVEGPKKRGRKPKPKPVIEKKENGQTDLLGLTKAKTENNDIDLVSRVKKRQQMTEYRRIQEAEEKRKKVEEERRRQEEERKRLEEDKKRQEYERCDRTLHEARTQLKNSERRLPLGTDRNHSRYWMLSEGAPGLYVEIGWVGEYIGYSTISQQQINAINEDTKSGAIPKEATWPICGPNMWFTVASEHDFNHLLSVLNPDGSREAKLLNAFKKNSENIIKSIQQRQELIKEYNSKEKESTTDETSNKLTTTTTTINGDLFHRDQLRKNLLRIFRDGHKGGIVQVANSAYGSFEASIQNADTCEEFAHVINQTLVNIPYQFLSYEMTGISCRKGKEGSNCENDITENEKLGADCKREVFRTNLFETKLFSRLALLLAFMDYSIRWDLFHHVTKSRRAATNKKHRSYQEEEEESAEEEDMEVDDGSSRRSSRLKCKQRTPKSSRRSSTNHLNTSSSSTRPVRNARKRTRNYRSMVNDEDEMEQAYNNDDSSNVEDEEDSCAAANSYDDDGDDDDYSEQEQVEESEDDGEDEADACVRIINKLLSFAYTQLFRDPVNGEDYGDYYDIIKKPISLSEILEKAEREEKDGERLYTFQQLVKDIRLIVDNAIEYNGINHFVAKDANRLSRAFKRQSISMLQLNEQSLELLQSYFPEN